MNTYIYIYIYIYICIYIGRAGPLRRLRRTARRPIHAARRGKIQHYVAAVRYDVRRIWPAIRAPRRFGRLRRATPCGVSIEVVEVRRTRIADGSRNAKRERPRSAAHLLREPVAAEPGSRRDFGQGRPGRDQAEDLTAPPPEIPTSACAKNTPAERSTRGKASSPGHRIGGRRAVSAAGLHGGGYRSVLFAVAGMVECSRDARPIRIVRIFATESPGWGNWGCSFCLGETRPLKLRTCLLRTSRFLDISSCTLRVRGPAFCGVQVLDLAVACLAVMVENAWIPIATPVHPIG